jgi:S1-C subfamily serine protease
MSTRKGTKKSFASVFLPVFVLIFTLAGPAFGNGPMPTQPIDANSPPDALKSAITDAIQKVKPSLVRIFVVASRYENGREVKYVATGSGVIITKDGCVITNHHVETPNRSSARCPTKKR